MVADDGANLPRADAPVVGPAREGGLPRLAEEQAEVVADELDQQPGRLVGHLEAVEARALLERPLEGLAPRRDELDRAARRHRPEQPVVVLADAVRPERLRREQEQAGGRARRGEVRQERLVVTRGERLGVPDDHEAARRQER